MTDVEKFKTINLEVLPISKIEILLSKHLNSKSLNYRSRIRQVLLNHLSKKKPSLLNDISLLNLDHPPICPEYTISISHNRSASGFALGPSSVNVGFDLEEIARISEPLIKRISSKEEIAQTPHPKSLFSAKEATWKACSSAHLIPTISNIQTSNWKELKNQWFEFQAHYNDKILPGKGYTIEFDQLILAIFIGPAPLKLRQP